MNHALDLFTEIFLSTEIWGYFGPLLLVWIGYEITKREKPLGVFYFIILMVMTFSTYMTNALFLDNVWKVLILIFGGLAVCIAPQFE